MADKKDEIFSKLQVVKRNGKKVDFNETKIAIAIKKGFDDVIESARKDDEITEADKYNEKDMQKVFHDVLNKIEKDYKDKDKIKIEEIQDLIEQSLKEKKYDDVYEAFANYREKRAQSRAAFTEDKRSHKFLKTLEGLALKSAAEDDTKRENGNIDGNSAMGTMLQFGSNVSKEFAKTYLMKKKFADAHDEGDIHIHDMDFEAMGTTTCLQIDIAKLFKGGFSTGHGFLREPNDIMSYSALAAIAIQSNQNDQHGGQSIPLFDYHLAPGIIKTYRKQLKMTIQDLLDYSDFASFINMKSVEDVISKITTIEEKVEVFEKFYKENESLKRLFTMSMEKAIAKTDRITYQAMEAFIHNLNTMHSRAGAQVPFSSVNFGTDTSPEGRMIIKNYLLAVDAGLGHSETPIFPISIFKVKEGINYNPGDPNYDLFKLSCKVSAKRLFPNFEFIDAPFNLQYYVPGRPETEVATMGCRTRVMGNVVDPDRQICVGRGNLSFTTINLPRLGIKHGIVGPNANKKADMKGFYEDLDQIIELCKDQLLERFEIQGKKRVYNFPFLMGQGNWMDSEKLKPNDKLKKVLKHGTLSVGFIGLAECLVALIGEHHGQSAKAQKLGLEIIGHIRKKMDEYSEQYKLNFSCLATPAEGLSGRFTKIDKAIYGKIKGVTDREYYTNSFHIPVYYNISIANKIKLEAPYHALTNAGHISYIELDGDVTENVEAFESIIRMMKEAGIGYGAINHPVDRDPVCGYVGVIKDVCPGCGRREGDPIPAELLKNLNFNK
ncbi:MAG TPA: anaerobic ribonucleoside triphosphate reductase [Candidatus Coprovivens excrementavium]|nr:anaerobic ribonucleoside triphosphate reductase [Candidatus Coprovivens excrementavium]